MASKLLGLQVFKGLKGGVQDVAVKIMTYSEELEAQRFWVEINLLKSLSFDRNIVQFYGCVLDATHPMLVGLSHLSCYHRTAPAKWSPPLALQLVFTAIYQSPECEGQIAISLACFSQ